MRLAGQLVVVTVFILSATTGFAQTIDDLYALVQQSRTVINNNATIDISNPESATFATTIPGQLVELNMVASKLNDSFISAINYPQPTFKARSSCLQINSKSAPTPITFGNLHVTLDGCDITAALIAQCNSNQCWATNPTTPMSSLAGNFGTSIYMNLSALNPQSISGCIAATGQTSFFDAAHTSHSIQFTETFTTAPAGGSLNYQIAIFNKAY